MLAGGSRSAAPRWSGPIGLRSAPEDRAGTPDKKRGSSDKGLLTKKLFGVSSDRNERGSVACLPAAGNAPRRGTNWALVAPVSPGRRWPTIQDRPRCRERAVHTAARRDTLAGQNVRSVETGRQLRASVIGEACANLHLFSLALQTLRSLLARREACRDGSTATVRSAYTPPAAA